MSSYNLTESGTWLEKAESTEGSGNGASIGDTFKVKLRLSQSAILKIRIDSLSKYTCNFTNKKKSVKTKKDKYWSWKKLSDWLLSLF